METVILVTGIAMLGNYLNQTKQPRGTLVPTDSTVAPNDIPSDSRVVSNFSSVMTANEYAQRKANNKFMLMDPATSGIMANDNQTGWPANLNDLAATLEQTNEPSRDMIYQEQKVGAPQNIKAVDPQTGKAVSTPFDKVYGGDMFRESMFKGIDDFMTAGQAKTASGVTEAFMPMGSQMSLLAGKEVDMQHANMNPAFKSGAHRASPNEALKDARIERFTGIASDYSTWAPKKEVSARINAGGPTKPAAITEVRDTEQRVVDSLGSNRTRNNFVTPTKPIAVERMNTDLLDIPTKSFNELYPSKAIQERGSRPNLGKMITGDRAVHDPLGFRKAPLPEDGREVVGNRSFVTAGAAVQAPSVREYSATQIHENEWMGAAHGAVKRFDGSTGTDAVRATDTIQRRNDVVTLPTMLPDIRQTRRALDPEYLLRDPEKGVEENYLRPADSAKGFRNRDGVDAPSITLKQLIDTTGLSGQHGYKSNTMAGAYKDLDVQAPMTLKAVNSETTYVAPMFKNKGFGIREHGVQDWNTLKQLLHHEYYGNSKSAVNRTMSYDAKATAQTNRTIEKTSTELPRGNIRSQGMTRDTSVDLKEHLLVEGRTHGVMNSDDPFFRDSSHDLKEEITNDPDRIFPNGEQRDKTYAHLGDNERSLVTYETANDRLDPSLVVPNTDLYPHLAK